MSTVSVLPEPVKSAFLFVIAQKALSPSDNYENQKQVLSVILPFRDEMTEDCFFEHINESAQRHDDWPLGSHTANLIKPSQRATWS